MPKRWADEHGIAVDRTADVPVGVQLAWTLRNAINSGRLGPGDQLPPVRQLAEELGVNPNTLRATYARLEAEDLIDTRHGRGTFVTAAGEGEGLSRLLADTTQAALEAGVDRRTLAAALYVEGTTGDDDEAVARRHLHQEIAALERIVAVMKPPTPQPDGGRAGRGPRILSIAELEQVRDDLIARISAADAPEAQVEPAAKGKRRPAPKPALGAARLRTR